jgi:hypothetical protein
MDPDHEMGARNAVILLERLWRKSGVRLAVSTADRAMSWSDG